MHAVYGGPAMLDRSPTSMRSPRSTTHHGGRHTVWGMSARMTRQCSRSGCAETATATLTYQYGLALVWLDDLSREREPHGYDLCARHTSRLSAPNGWRVEDRRARRVVQFSAYSRLAG